MDYITMTTHARNLLRRDALWHNGEHRVITAVYISGRGREVELFGGDTVEFDDDAEVTIMRLLTSEYPVPVEHMDYGLIAQMREDRLCSMTVYANENQAVVWSFNHEDGGHYHGDYFPYRSHGPGYIRLALQRMAERTSSIYWL